MSDQTIATIVGFGIVVGLRLLDYLLPKGYMWRRVRQWSVKKEDDDE